ncbi:hypothetical protein SUGI_1486010 [Cryptomeria japonica]|uniref:beta-glucosidase n=1 Tax=Cryptomeria japonica TaxID=3369 RepID=A0AAD3NVM7_CRYJA|nr:hypothetical protein SUGI_1451020 [Cryptomeria japonica]GLJ58864.1 hypothetical protein SUGI_1481070 [Cryptomeria japonica]GLJ58947.1 hypothetical protein SUGI_1486010 [Cryptomeria japonica]
MDMVMVPFKFKNYISNLTKLVNSGQISMSKIDDSIRRILRVKFIAGLFEHPKTDRSLLGMVGNPRNSQRSGSQVTGSSGSMTVGTTIVVGI